MIKIYKYLFIIFIIIPICTSAQYKNSSKFLYGKSRSTVPYYLSLQLGMVTNDFSFNKDFINYGNAFGWGFSFEKPLGYRPALALTFRTMGKYESINLKTDNPDFITTHTISTLKSSYEFSLNYSYMVYDWYGWQYRAGVGIGFVNNTIDVTDTILRSIKSSTPIIPIQISTTRVLKKRWEMEIGYRYYLGLDNKIEGVAYNNTLDKYSFLFLAIKYRLGEKDYRFQKSNACPTPDQ